jgi:hypothetical protein
VLQPMPTMVRSAVTNSRTMMRFVSVVMFYVWFVVFVCILIFISDSRYASEPSFAMGCNPTVDDGRLSSSDSRTSLR